VWTPEPVIVPELLLAASGATEGGWSICAGGECIAVGVISGESARLRSCASNGQ
jgi:hypothetical protein